MRKLYIVHATPEDFKELINEVRRVGNVHQADYDLLIRKRIAEFLGDSGIAFNSKQDDLKVIAKLKPIAEKYNDIFYSKLIEWLTLWTSNRARVFVRVTDSKVINRLKRKYKRPNYMTILLGNKNEMNGKFDVKIQTDDKPLLSIEIKKFVKTKLYSMHFINTPKLKR